MKVMIVVTHLLGTGHLSRALTLGRAFVADGQAHLFDVALSLPLVGLIVRYRGRLEQASD